MIYSRELKIDNNLKIIQQFSTLVAMMKFDLTKYLSCPIDNILENINNLAKYGCQLLYADFQRKQRYLTEILTEEWRIILSPLEIAWHCEEIKALEHQVHKLEQRLQQLEAK